MKQRQLLIPILLFWVGITLMSCGGGRLIPRDLKDFVTARLKTERRNVEVTQPFRTSIILRVDFMNIEQAHQAERTLIATCLDYFQRDGVKNFINDTIVYIVRLNNDPDTNLQYWTVSYDTRQLVEGQMSLEEYIERCDRRENWSMEL